MKPLNIRKAFVFLATAFIVCSQSAWALDCSAAGVSGGIENPDNNPSSILYIMCPLQRGIMLGIYFVGAVLIILVLYGAIKALMSTGDARQLEGAKLVWTYAALGAAVILFAIFIVQIAYKLLGSGVSPLNLVGTMQGALDSFMTCITNPLACF